MAALAQLLDRIEQVPPLSAAASRLLQLQSRPDRSLAQAAEIVEVDAGLTMAVLKASNSAAAAPASPITSVRQACTYLGERTILALSLSACVPGGMVMPIPGYQSEHGGLWRHSLRSGVAARDLAHRCNHPVEAELAFTSGILHDIGKPILSSVLKSAAKDELRDAAVAKQDIAALERKMVGMSHAEVGEALAKRWRLPETLQAGIRYHHEPTEAPEKLRSLTYSVHVGVMHAILTGFDSGLDDLTYRLDTKFLTVFDLNVVDFGAMMFRVERDTAEAMARVGDP